MKAGFAHSHVRSLPHDQTPLSMACREAPVRKGVKELTQKTHIREAGFHPARLLPLYLPHQKTRMRPLVCEA